MLTWGYMSDYMLTVNFDKTTEKSLIFADFISEFCHSVYRRVVIE
jgi:hypothetical protein